MHTFMVLHWPHIKALLGVALAPHQGAVMTCNAAVHQTAERGHRSSFELHRVYIWDIRNRNPAQGRTMATGTEAWRVLYLVRPELALWRCWRRRHRSPACLVRYRLSTCMCRTRWSAAAVQSAGACDQQCIAACQRFALACANDWVVGWRCAFELLLQPPLLRRSVKWTWCVC